jgi:hypothetical protein
MDIAPVGASSFESQPVPSFCLKSQVPYKKIDSSRMIQTFTQKAHEFDPSFHPKIFAHIVGNDYLERSSLNGASFHDTLHYARSELSRALSGDYGISWEESERHLLEDSLEELSSGFEVFLKWKRLLADKTLTEEQFIDLLLRHVQDLKPGKGLLIPGGRSGHGLLYEITRTEQGELHFHIFNSGSGLLFHPGRWVQKNQSIKQQSLCRLSFSLGNQFQLLKIALTKAVELQQSPTKVVGKHNYFKLLRQLVNSKNYIEPSQEDRAWMNPQKSGVCAWRCFTISQRTRFSHQTQKTLQLCAKIRAFNQLQLQYPEAVTSDSFLYKKVFKPALAKLTLKMKEAGLEPDQVLLDKERAQALTVKKSIWVKAKENVQLILRFLFLLLQQLWLQVRQVSSHVFAHMSLPYTPTSSPIYN